MGKILRWGLLGTAHINKSLIPPLRSSRRNQLAAVASRSLEKAQAYAREWRIPGAYGSYQALLDDPKIDVVYISLPNDLHVEWALKAAEAGKHVLCEKPISLRTEDVDALLAASKTYHVHIAEAFMYRHHAQTLKVQELIETGAIGELQTVQGAFFFLLDRPGSYRWEPGQGGGSLWDMGCYPLSYAIMAVGEAPVEVMGWKRIAPSGIDHTFFGQLRFANGVLAQIQSSFALPSFSRMELRGTAGALIVPDPFKPSQRSQFILQQDKDQKVRVKGSELYLGEVENMADVILDGTPARIPLEESRRIVQSLAALHRSAETGQPVKV